jgi:Tol biopolymer transport system component
VTPEGRVKVLDFGLAKALAGEPTAGDPTASPTLTMRETEAGVILGTAGYMAPEQAKGKAVDKRADIWALGVVLYEMLAARRLFEGETVQETLAAVLMKEPPLDTLPAATPGAVRKLLRRCLERDVRRRLRDIGEARIALEEMLVGVPEEATAPPASRRHFIFLWAILATLALMALATVHLREKESELPVLRFTIFPPEKTAFDFTNAVQGPPALSPDGRRLAFRASGEGHSQLWLRTLDQVAAQPLAGTEGATFPFWSPDSRFIGFFAGGKLKRVDLSGGPPLTLADAPNGRGGSWSKEGVIVFAPTNRSALQSVTASGGATKPVTVLEGPADRTSHRFPWFLPDGRHFLYVSGINLPGRLHLAALDSKQDKVLGPASSYVIYSQEHLLFLREDTLMAQAFDSRLLAAMREAVPIARHVAGVDAILHGAFSVSENGTLVYQQTAPAPRTLVWFDRGGKRLSTVGEPADMGDLQLSPDRQSATVTVFDPRTGLGDIWIYDLTHGRPSRFTFGGGNSAAVWSPDGRTIAYNNSGGLWQKPLSGLGDAQQLYRVDGYISSVSTWSPNGFLVYEPAAFLNLWLLPMAPGRPGGERKPLPFLPASAVVSDGQFSPDGRWMAYASDETQRFEIYAIAFPEPGSKQQISAGGGIQPRWRRDEKEIFFRAPDDQLMAAQVTVTGNTLGVGSVRSLFGLSHDTRFSPPHYTYDVSADGQRVLALVSAGQTTTTSQPLTVVQNWTAALKK